MMHKIALLILLSLLTLLPASLDHALGQVQAAESLLLLREKRLQFISDVDAAIWLNMPAPETEVFGSPSVRLHSDIDEYTQFRLMAYIITPGATNSYFKLQTSSNNVTFTDAEATPNTGRLDITQNNTLVIGSWATLAAGAAQNATYLRLVGVGGNGVADPGIGNLSVEFRD